MRHVFGWDYPPGAAGDPSAPWNQDSDEPPCAVCDRPLDECLCPECPVCGAVGDPACVEQHGLPKPSERCPKCEKNPALPPHSCPFQEDIHNDPNPEYCACCDGCRQECCDAI